MTDNKVEYDYRSMTRYQVSQMPQEDLDAAEQHMDHLLDTADYDDPEWDNMVNFAVYVEEEQEARQMAADAYPEDTPVDQLDYPHNQPIER